jgi:hypothetical protein
MADGGRNRATDRRYEKSDLNQVGCNPEPLARMLHL